MYPSVGWAVFFRCFRVEGKLYPVCITVEVIVRNYSHNHNCSFSVLDMSYPHLYEVALSQTRILDYLEHLSTLANSRSRTCPLRCFLRLISVKGIILESLIPTQTLQVYHLINVCNLTKIGWPVILIGEEVDT